jgi:ketosteroid isomerase-like protein
MDGHAACAGLHAGATVPISTPVAVLAVDAGTLARAEVTVSKVENEERNKAAVQARFDAWAAGTGGPFDLLAEDATWTIVGRSDASRTYRSREEFMGEVIRPFNARMRRGLKPAIRRIYADGDTVIVFFDAKGVACDGEPYNNTYAWFLEMRDGKVVNASAFFDSIEFNDLWRRVAPSPPAGN